MYLAWKIVSLLDHDPPVYEHSGIFRIHSNASLYKRDFRISPDLCYVPLRFSPTIKFHQAIKSLISHSFGISLKFKGFPYVIPLSEVGSDVHLQIQPIRFFPPRIVSLTVRVLGLPSTLDVNQLINYQNLIHDSPIKDIVGWVIGLAETFDPENFGSHESFVSKPLLHMPGVFTAEAFQTHFERNILKYVGILIRNRTYEFMSSDIIPRNIVEKNRQLNTKSSEQLLIDRQGILYLTSTDIEKVYSRVQVHNLCETALVIEMFLNNYYSFRRVNEDFADFIFFKILRWIEKPNTIIDKSVSHQFVWDLMTDEFIKSRDKYLTNQRLLNQIEEKKESFEQITGNWWDERDFSSVIARKAREASGLKLDFLSNNALIDIILEDYREAKQSFQCKNYKATIVLCGSIMEAIITAALEEKTQSRFDKRLVDLIDEARNHRLIIDNDLLSQLHTLRRYRNIIHPRAQDRRKFEVNEHKAAVAVRYIYILVEHLNKTM